MVDSVMSSLVAAVRWLRPWWSMRFLANSLRMIGTIFQTMISQGVFMVVHRKLLIIHC